MPHSYYRGDRRAYGSPDPKEFDPSSLVGPGLYGFSDPKLGEYYAGMDDAEIHAEALKYGLPDDAVAGFESAMGQPNMRRFDVPDDARLLDYGSPEGRAYYDRLAAQHGHDKAEANRRLSGEGYAGVRFPSDLTASGVFDKDPDSHGVAIFPEYLQNVRNGISGKPGGFDTGGFTPDERVRRDPAPERLPGVIRDDVEAAARGPVGDEVPRRSPEDLIRRDPTVRLPTGPSITTVLPMPEWLTTIKRMDEGEDPMGPEDSPEYESWLREKWAKENPGEPFPGDEPSADDDPYYLGDGGLEYGENGWPTGPREWEKTGAWTPGGHGEDPIDAKDLQKAFDETPDPGGDSPFPSYLATPWSMLPENRARDPNAQWAYDDRYVPIDDEERKRAIAQAYLSPEFSERLPLDDKYRTDDPEIYGGAHPGLTKGFWSPEDRSALGDLAAQGVDEDTLDRMMRASYQAKAPRNFGPDRWNAFRAGDNPDDLDIGDMNPEYPY